jgi:branched-chain amino acid transport system permease protein
LGVVNFAHGALFMIGAFCAVTLNRMLTLFHTVIDDPEGLPRQSAEGRNPYVDEWFGPEIGAAIIDWSVPLSILFAIPVMMLIG